MMDPLTRWMTHFRQASYVVTRPLALILIIPLVLTLYSTYPVLGFFSMCVFLPLVFYRIMIVIENKKAPKSDTIDNDGEKEHVDRVISEMEKQFSDQRDT